MELRKASEVREEHMYSDTRIAIVINDAAYEKQTKVFVNVDLNYPCVIIYTISIL